MSVKIVDNTSQIKSQIAQKASLFLRFMEDEMIVISTPVTPKKTGRMRMDVVKQVLGLKGTVKWGKNYAVYQETRQYKRYTTPGTGSKFAENAAKKLPDSTGKIAKKAQLI